MTEQEKTLVVSTSHAIQFLNNIIAGVVNGKSPHLQGVDFRNAKYWYNEAEKDFNKLYPNEYLQPAPDVNKDSILWSGNNLIDVMKFLGKAYISNMNERSINGKRVVRFYSGNVPVNADKGDSIYKGQSGDFYLLSPNHK